MRSSFSDSYVVDARLYEPAVSCRYEDCSQPSKRRPYITIGMVLPGGRLWHPESIRARVDTGADITCLTANVARAWNVDLGRVSMKEVKMHLLADGSVVLGVQRELDLVVGEKTTLGKVPVTFPLPDGDLRNEIRKRYSATGLRLSAMPVRQNLFGLDGVIDQAMICLDDNYLHLFRKRAPHVRSSPVIRSP